VHIAPHKISFLNFKRMKTQVACLVALVLLAAFAMPAQAALDQSEIDALKTIRSIYSGLSYYWSDANLASSTACLNWWNNLQYITCSNGHVAGMYVFFSFARLWPLSRLFTLYPSFDAPFQPCHRSVPYLGRSRKHFSLSRYSFLRLALLLY